jgi:DNA-binding NtrC family response regulator
MAMQRILLVEDDSELRTTVAAHLRSHGFDVRDVATHAEARTVLVSTPIDGVVAEHRGPDGEVFELLPDAFARTPRPVVVVLTAHGSIDLAVRLVKEGVQQFLTKPIDLPTLVGELRQHLGQRSAMARRAQPAPRVSGVSQRAVSAPLFGTSEASQRLREQVSRLRESNGPILFVGEAGSGKSTLARYVHAMGSRAQGAFVEATGGRLFDGDAVHADKTSLLDAAAGGTLFLTEVALLDLETQARLVRIIDDARAAHSSTADVRIMAATKGDLAVAVRVGTFRADLYERLSPSTVTVPPLRERPGDIVPLARQFLDMLATNLGRPGATLAVEAEGALVGHTWPGNVRELKNCLERALILGDGGLVLAHDVQFQGAQGASVAPASTPRTSGIPVRSLEYVEIEHIRTVLGDVGGRVDAAAVELQMPRSTLYERIRRYGIDLSDFRARRKS